MAERSEEQLHDDDVVIDDDIEDVLDASRRAGNGDSSIAGTNRSGVDGTTDRQQRGLLGRLRGRIALPSIGGSLFEKFFSPRTFLIALLASVAGAFIAGLVIPFFGSLAALGGIFAVAFVFGLISDRRRYLEVGLAGGTTAVLGMLMEFLVLTVVGSGQLLAVIGAGSGLAVAVLGHYFGRDLRSGLSREI